MSALPLHEYQCDRCGRFEVIQKFSDPPLAVCVKCGAPVQRLPSAPAIQFKGTGWYITDYARKAGGEGSKGKEGGADGGKQPGKDSAKDASAPSSSGESSAGKSEPSQATTGTGTASKPGGKPRS